jgi:hypothetical protein
MVRFNLILLAIGGAAAFGVWLVPDGTLESLLMLIVGIALLILLGSVPITLLQRFAPMEEHDSAAAQLPRQEQRNRST